MISPSLHPDPVSAVCERRRRAPFALTPRAIGLLLAGFIWLIPGFWDGRLAWAMLAWDALVLLAALADGLRLPAPAKLTVTRSWSNAPALDSETEIELTVENHGRMILDCRLVDDLPPALVAEPATHRLTAFPGIPANLRYRVQPKERGDWETGWLYLRYRSGLGLAERWARAPLTQTVRVYPALRTGEEQQIFLARADRLTCNCAAHNNADWAVTLRACASTARATIFAISAGRRRRGAAAPSPASIRANAASRFGWCSTAAG